MKIRDLFKPKTTVQTAPLASVVRLSTGELRFIGELRRPNGVSTWAGSPSNPFTDRRLVDLETGSVVAIRKSDHTACEVVPVELVVPS